MESAWKELGKLVNSDEEWERIWGFITHAKHQSQQALSPVRKQRSDVRDGYQSYVLRCRKLAKEAASKDYFDPRIYQLLDDETLKIMGVTEHASQHPLSKSSELFLTRYLPVKFIVDSNPISHPKYFA